MKRHSKAQRIACIVFLFICLFLSPPTRVFSNQTSDNADSYYKLVDLCKRYFQLEEELFQRLTFKLSADQVVKSGTSFKLTLEDNLGRKWIFKEKGTNSVIAHRLYTLFGLETPEIHKVELELNGKLYPGTLQKFILAPATLCSYYAPASVSPAGLEYLMKAQVIDWLMRDFDPNCSNFLVLSLDKENRADKLMRIDQTCAWGNFASSELDYEHMVVLAKRLHGTVVPNCYSLIEEAFQKKEIDLDLKRAYVFVRFVADFPRAQLEEVIWDRKNPGLNSRQMLKGFRKLYSKLAALRGVRVDFSGNPVGSDNLKESCANLRNQLNTLEKANTGTNSSLEDRYVRISATASLDGFQVMYRIYELCWFKKGNLEKECEKALKTLAELSSGAHPNEKKAISLYMQEIRKIQSGKGMTYPLNQINKLVDPVP